MKYRIGWTWLEGGKLGDRVLCDQPSAETEEALGMKAVPVVMVELPTIDKDGLCPPECFFIKHKPGHLDKCRMDWHLHGAQLQDDYNPESKIEDQIEIVCRRGSDCPAGKGKAEKS